MQCEYVKLGSQETHIQKQVDIESFWGTNKESVIGTYLPIYLDMDKEVCVCVSVKHRHWERERERERESVFG